MSIAESKERLLNGISNSEVQPFSKTDRGGIPDGRPFALKRVDRFVECVVPHAVEVRLEAVAAPPGIERVEDDDQAIVGAQTLSVPRRFRHNPVRIAVEHSGPMYKASSV